MLSNDRLASKSTLMNTLFESLDFGRDQLAMPGPSVVPERVLRAMHRPAPNIYAGELIDLTEKLRADLNDLAGSTGGLAFYIGNGHAVWEASLTNTFSKGDKALFLVNGRFGLAWATIGKELGLDVQLLDFGVTESVNADRVEAVLSDDKKHEIKAVLTVQTDTATSSSNELAAIRRAIDNAAHPALFMVDSIASFACEPFNMEALNVDLMITATQKGLMTPPGVGLMFTNNDYWKVQQKADLVSPYWNAHPRVHPATFPDNFFGTPPTHHLFGLREAVDMLLEEGIENCWQRHALFARSVWAAVNAWRAGGAFSCQIENEAMRSMAVTAIKTPEGVAKELQRVCSEQLGLVLGVGLNPNPTPGAMLLDDTFRIGHMGHLSAPMLLGTLGTIEAALTSLAVPHGPGAVDAAAGVIGGALKRSS